MSQYSPADPSSVDGYTLDATSQMWKDFCGELPCDVLMQWPGYSTAIIEVTIGGEPAIIQCWKGHCEDAVAQLPPLPQPYGVIEFPGGFGAEVGVYRRRSGLELPVSMTPAIPSGWPPALELAAKTWFEARALRFNISGVTDYWWPANDLVVGSGVPVSFTLVDPIHGDPLIGNYHTNTYWTCQWMRPASFAKWCLDWHAHHGPVGPLELMKLTEVSKYTLNFAVAGVDYVWDEAGIRAT